MHISLENLKAMAAALDGITIETIHQKKTFKLEVVDEGLRYTPKSSGKSRLQRWKYISRFLDHFNKYEQRIYNPGVFKEISKNASYLLAIIRRGTNTV